MEIFCGVHMRTAFKCSAWVVYKETEIGREIIISLQDCSKGNMLLDYFAFFTSVAKPFFNILCL